MNSYEAENIELKAENIKLEAENIKLKEEIMKLNNRREIRIAHYREKRIAHYNKNMSEAHYNKCRGHYLWSSKKPSYEYVNK